MHIKLLQLGHTIKPGMPEHATPEYGTVVEQQNTQKQWWNNGTPVENPQIPTEHLRNTSETPLNNRTIQNEAQS